jgi:putative effector of murein hydrolase
MHGVAGVSAFVAFDSIAQSILKYYALPIPPSIAVIVSLGSLAAVPRVGTALQTALGPGVAWLRMLLPFLLATPLLSPLVVNIPDALLSTSALSFSALHLVGTIGLIGWTSRLFSSSISSHADAPAVIATPAMQRTTAAIAKYSKSLRVAAILGLLGVAMSAALWYHNQSTDCSTRRTDAQVRAPAFLGLTASLFVSSAAFVPASVALFLPPTVCAGVGTGVVLSLLGHLYHSNTTGSNHSQSGAQRELRHYVDGAQRVAIDFVQPAIGTLAMYAHTHRHALLAFARPLTACVVVAPLVLLAASAAASRLFDLPSELIGVLLPASTTAGLALAMAPALLPTEHAVPTELVVLGPIIFGVVGMCSWPLLLRFTGLSSAPAVSQGLAIGSASHVSGMAALAAAGRTQAADAAAIALFALGVSRCIALQVL